MAENQLLQYEAGQDYFPMEKMTSADNQVFTASATIYSKFIDRKEEIDYSPKLRPNGIITGGKVVAAVSGSNDVVDAAKATVYLDGEKTSVIAANDITITRASNGTHRINSLTITNLGVYAMIAGADSVGASAYSTSRGVDGGPPWIPTGSIEVAQIFTSTTTPAVITDIRAVPNVSKELSNKPVPLIFTMGETGEDTAFVKFDSALPDIHSDDNGVTTFTKEVWIEVYEPSFADVTYASEFVPPVYSYTTASSTYYNQKSRGSTSASLGQGSFTVGHDNNITDPLVGLQGSNLTFKYFANRFELPFILCQGVLGVAPSNPAGGEFTAACTISAELPAVNKTGE